MTSSSPIATSSSKAALAPAKAHWPKPLRSTLARPLCLEPFADNPFWSSSIWTPSATPFPSSSAFLAQRYKQVKAALTARTLFRDALVADYLFAKSDLFAKITLPKTEYPLFRNLYDVMAEGMPQPELILYLKPGAARQQAQIAARGRSYEQDIDVDYLARLEKGLRAALQAAHVAAGSSGSIPQKSTLWPGQKTSPKSSKWPANLGKWGCTKSSPDPGPPTSALEKVNQALTVFNASTIMAPI